MNSVFREIRHEGYRKGRIDGWQNGWQEGRVEGFREGRQAALLYTATRLWELRFPENTLGPLLLWCSLEDLEWLIEEIATGALTAPELKETLHQRFSKPMTATSQVEGSHQTAQG